MGWKLVSLSETSDGLLILSDSGRILWVDFANRDFVQVQEAPVDSEVLYWNLVPAKSPIIFGVPLDFTLKAYKLRSLNDDWTYWSALVDVQ